MKRIFSMIKYWYDSAGRLTSKSLYSVNCDSLENGKKLTEISGIHYKFDSKGSIIDEEIFIIDFDTLRPLSPRLYKNITTNGCY